MDYPVFSSILTVAAFATFVLIVIWAYSGKRKADFDAASRLPFALPDEQRQVTGGIREIQS